MNRGVFMTRSEISARINALTRDKNNRNSELRSYQSSLNCARNLVSKLNNGLSYLNTAKDNLNRYFTIDGKTADKGDVDSVKNEINNMVKQINTGLIPSINSQISRLQREIDSITREINSLNRQYALAEM